MKDFKIIKVSDLIETDYLFFYRLSQFSCLDFRLIRMSCRINNKCITQKRINDLILNGFIKEVSFLYRPLKKNVKAYKLTSKSVDVVKTKYKDVLILNSKANPHDLKQAEYVILNFLEYIETYKNERYIQKEFDLTKEQLNDFSTLDGYITVGDKRLYIETITNYYSKDMKRRKKNFFNLLVETNSNVELVHLFLKY